MEPDNVRFQAFDINIEQGTRGQLRSVVTMQTPGGSERFIMRIRLDGEELDQDTLALLASYQAGGSGLTPEQLETAHRKMSAISHEVSNIFQRSMSGRAGSVPERINFSASNITHHGDHRNIRAAFHRAVGNVTRHQSSNDMSTKQAAQRLYDALKDGAGASVRSARSSLSSGSQAGGDASSAAAPSSRQRVSGAEGTNAAEHSERLQLATFDFSDDLSTSSDSLADAARSVASSLSNLLGSLSDGSDVSDAEGQGSLRVSEGINFGEEEKLSGDDLFDAAKSVMSSLSSVLEARQSAIPEKQDESVTRRERTANWVVDVKNAIRETGKRVAPADSSFAELMAWAKENATKIVGYLPSSSFQQSRGVSPESSSGDHKSGALQKKTGSEISLAAMQGSDLSDNDDVISEYSVTSMASVAAELYPVPTSSPGLVLSESILPPPRKSAVLEELSEAGEAPGALEIDVRRLSEASSSSVERQEESSEGTTDIGDTAEASPRSMERQEEASEKAVGAPSEHSSAEMEHAAEDSSSSERRQEEAIGAPSGHSSTGFGVAVASLEQSILERPAGSRQRTVLTSAMRSAERIQHAPSGRLAVQQLAARRLNWRGNLDQLRGQLTTFFSGAQHITEGAPEGGVSTNPSAWGNFVGTLIRERLPVSGSGSRTQVILPLSTLVSGDRTTVKFVGKLLKGSGAPKLYVETRDRNGAPIIWKVSREKVSGRARITTKTQSQVDTSAPIVQLLDRQTLNLQPNDLRGVSVHQIVVTSEGGQLWRPDLNDMHQVQHHNGSALQTNVMMVGRPSVEQLLERGEMHSLDSAVMKEAAVTANAVAETLLSALHLTGLPENQLEDAATVLGDAPGAFSSMSVANNPGISQTALTAELTTMLLLHAGTNSPSDGLALLLSARSGSQTHSLMRRVLSHNASEGSVGLIRNFLLPLAAGNMTTASGMLKEMAKKP